MKDKAPKWLEHLSIPSSKYEAWKQSSNGDESVLAYALKKGLVDEAAYLKWARNHYELPSLKSDYFNEDPDFEFWGQIRTVSNWGPHMVPLCEWDGHVFVACLEPDPDIHWSFPVQYVLAPQSGLETLWQNLSFYDEKSFTGIPPIPSDQAPAIETEGSQGAPPPPVASEPKEAAPVSAGAKVIPLGGPPPLRPPTGPVAPVEPAVVAEAPAPASVPEQPAAVAEAPGQPEPSPVEAAVEVPTEDQSDVAISMDDLADSMGDLAADSDAAEMDATQVKASSEESDIEIPEGMEFDLDSVESEEPALEGLADAAESDEGGEAPEGFEMPEGMELDLGSNDDDDSTPEGIEVSADNESEDLIPEGLEIAMQPEEKPAIQQPAPPAPKGASNPAVPALQEDTDEPNEASPIPLKPKPATISSTDGVEEKTGGAVHEMTNGIITLDAPESLESCKNLDEAFAWAFEQSKAQFDKSMVLKIEADNFRGWKWDKNWRKQSAKRYPLDKPSVFRITFKSKLPYHGFVAKSDVNRDFFSDWGFQELPEHVTAIPIIVDGTNLATLVFTGTKNANTQQALNLAERLSIQLRDYLRENIGAA